MSSMKPLGFSRGQGPCMQSLQTPQSHLSKRGSSQVMHADDTVRAARALTPRGMSAACRSEAPEAQDYTYETLLNNIPESLLLHVLSVLPGDAQAYAGKLVCKASRDQLRAQRTIRARSPDLPSWVLKEAYKQCNTTAERIQLMAARASQVGSQAHPPLL